MSDIFNVLLFQNTLRTATPVVLAALAARGESTVTGLSHIERGYAEFVPTLRHLGAEITIAEI